jgi:hypothetical protein
MEKFNNEKKHIEEELSSESAEDFLKAKDLPVVGEYTSEELELLYGNGIKEGLNPGEYLEYNGLLSLSPDEEVPSWVVCRSEIKEAPDGSEYYDVYGLKGNVPEKYATSLKEERGPRFDIKDAQNISDLYKAGE